MDADANANTNADADAKGSTKALSERCSVELMNWMFYIFINVIKSYQPNEVVTMKSSVQQSVLQ